MQSSKPRLGTKQRTRGSIGIRKSKAEAMLHEKSDESIVAMKGGPMKPRTCSYVGGDVVRAKPVRCEGVLVWTESERRSNITVA